MHGVYFHSSAVLLSFMNMKSRNLESRLSFTAKFSRLIGLVIQIHSRTGAAIYFGRTSSVSGDCLRGYGTEALNTGLNCFL